jgi:hypothetical protein
MNLDDAWNEFSERVTNAFPEAAVNVALGASNAAFMMMGGFRLGLYNIDALDYKGLLAANRSLVLLTRVILPGDNILNLGISFSGDSLRAVRRRRDQIDQQLKAKATDRKANKVRFFLHPTGIYMAQEDFPSLTEVPETAGSPVRADLAFFADVERGSELTPVETEYIRYLGTLLGETPFQLLGSNGLAAGGTALSPATADFSALYGKILALGASYERALVERYHIALNHLARKHFVILTGISGTGKTLLAKAYAYAVLNVSALSLPSEAFHLIAVRPDWTEPAHLLGFMDAVSGSYQRTRFVDALLQAHNTPTRPVFVCLDEMNLAQPEHYFADILSAMETGEPIHLHSESRDVGVPRSIPWPNNLYLIGTVNMDETTRPFSPKVLDRANVIDMSKVDMRAVCRSLADKDPVLSAVLDEALVGRLERISAILAPHGLHFGYRVVEELARYVAFSREKGLLSDALDVQLEQKVLTKLRGGPEHEAMLGALIRELSDLPRSQETLERMRVELARYESFQYWR